MGRWLIGVGLLLVLAGVVVLGLDRMGVRPGHLPGDLSWRGRGVQMYFPLGTCLVLSAVLSLLLWLFSRIRR